MTVPVGGYYRQSLTCSETLNRVFKFTGRQWMVAFASSSATHSSGPTPQEVVRKSSLANLPQEGVSCFKKDIARIDCLLHGMTVPLCGHHIQSLIRSQTLNQVDKFTGWQWMVPYFVRTFASSSATHSSGQTPHEEKRKDISTVEDPFDAPTYNIPEKSITFTEGASYTVIILAGLGIAGAAAYAVFKELIFQEWMREQECFSFHVFL